MLPLGDSAQKHPDLSSWRFFSSKEMFAVLPLHVALCTGHSNGPNRWRALIPHTTFLSPAFVRDEHQLLSVFAIHRARLHASSHFIRLN